MGGKVRIPLIDQGGGVNNWHLLGGAGFSPVLRGVNPPFPPPLPMCAPNPSQRGAQATQWR